MRLVTLTQFGFVVLLSLTPSPVSLLNSPIVEGRIEQKDFPNQNQHSLLENLIESIE